MSLLILPVVVTWRHRLFVVVGGPRLPHHARSMLPNLLTTITVRGDRKRSESLWPARGQAREFCFPMARFATTVTGGKSSDKRLKQASLDFEDKQILRSATEARNRRCH